ncbi:hydroxyethylthiazole kinase [Leucobacter tenebrionis]|uniref:hydroxyethylthiazole kinase n=1 Tax=Leucobacter tenebrionis TaxID=2873270 RepID=UPI00210391AA|nr:hydroxyethylthiazole kinase [Leucobacter tenebrionis]
MTRTHDHLSASSGALLSRLRIESPLVQCLTNTVTTNLVANAVLAVGGSPAMVDIPGEAGVFAGTAGAVLINVGTPSAEQRGAMIEAARAASQAGTPWVLDPVGIGLPVRTDLVRELMSLRPTAIRGNASEIRALAGFGASVRGVDATDAVDDAQDAAVEIAQSCGAVVAVSGTVDLVTDGTSMTRISNGTELFTRITGAGCALGGVLAAFLAIGDDRLSATTAACLAYTVAGELAAERADLPGSFAVALLDSLGGLGAAQLHERARLS